MAQYRHRPSSRRGHNEPLYTTTDNNSNKYYYYYYYYYCCLTICNIFMVYYYSNITKKSSPWNIVTINTKYPPSYIPPDNTQTGINFHSISDFLNQSHTQPLTHSIIHLVLPCLIQSRIEGSSLSGLNIAITWPLKNIW